MPNISGYLNKIISERYAKDVRQAIHDAIQQCYEDSAGGIAPVITTKKVALGTEVTVTVGERETNFTVLNGTATTEEVKTYVEAYLGDHPELVVSVGDGTISPEKTTFFDKREVGVNKVYTPIYENGELNPLYSHTVAGRYINSFSIEYRKVGIAVDSSTRQTVFRKVSAGERVTLRGSESDIFAVQEQKAAFFNANIYAMIVQTTTTTVTWSTVDENAPVITYPTKTALGQIGSDDEGLIDVWPEKGSYYVYQFEFEPAPFDGYICFYANTYNIESFSKFPTREYYAETLYAHTLEDTLKNDPFVGEKMTTLLGLNFNPVLDKPAKFNFKPLLDAIASNEDNASAVLEKLTDPIGTLQYVGGICANKKIYCCPNSADSVLVYDTASDYFYNIATGLGTNSFKWTGFVMWDGYLYSIPRGVNQMLRINPVTDEVKVINLNTNYPVAPYGDYRDSHHYNGVISDDGYMYLPPAYSSDKLLKISMDDFSHEELDFGSTDVSTWIGCVKHPTENAIIFLSTKVFRIWNCDTDEFNDIVDGTTRACYDMVYDPRYNAFIGICPNHIFALSMTDGTVIDSEYINYMENGYGITLGLDGKYYHLEGSKAYVFSFDGATFTQHETLETSANVGASTPVVAGQVIANNGDIYGIPASGGMTRVRFEDVGRRLPDYIVSSQYYGKY